MTAQRFIGGLAIIAAAFAATAQAERATPTPAAAVTCSAAQMSIRPEPDPTTEVVLAAVRLPSPTVSLRLRAAPRVPAGWRFAKFALLVRNSATPVTLTVPPAVRREITLTATGVAVGGTSTLRLDPCPDQGLGNWTLWSGGVLARTPGCYPITVTTAQKSTTTRLAVGARC